MGLRLALGLIIIAVLFALMFKIFPDAKIKWKNVWISSFLTTFLFEIGKVGLGLYFCGAEFTHTYAVMHSGKVIPTEIAKTEIQRKTN